MLFSKLGSLEGSRSHFSTPQNPRWQSLHDQLLAQVSSAEINTDPVISVLHKDRAWDTEEVRHDPWLQLLKDSGVDTSKHRGHCAQSEEAQAYNAVGEGLSGKASWRSEHG